MYISVKSQAKMCYNLCYTLHRPIVLYLKVEGVSGSNGDCCELFHQGLFDTVLAKILVSLTLLQ